MAKKTPNMNTLRRWAKDLDIPFTKRTSKKSLIEKIMRVK